MEIERKFTIRKLPDNLRSYPKVHIQQGYLSTNPVVRIRKEDDHYYLTYKGQGMLAREEHNLPLTRESYEHMLPKCDGNIISKLRYKIPLEHPKFNADCPAPPDNYHLIIELDVFEPPFEPLIMAEVEFGSKAAAESFVPPDWFLEDVTYNSNYHNSVMSQMKF
ncbi:MAG: CYTH domain-containing protein [Lachnospiraceae bacterium]|nr:CYTH domain-containing protein [Lachnospiraceae bacterium]